ncbi:gamma-mobile-trio protein GmtX [Shewanella sp. 5_MG-2023]|uniref:gamma-mobile-trio protein GmtX n=1 Tax=Shewanella sp. 5_MG-2023 TaxID=3062656 RepID=UPI0026E130F7|nr:gamma-mobile-trio protein GmtX [Shewanella sp. 5_MG-2023]MDO6642096.1 gamma-mobile-trio protein GmtX [Shewanella sp. 5_MG-2023]
MSHKPHELCEALKQISTPKTASSIELIHQICTEQSERGSCDFTIATIGRLSEAVNGPKTQAIRNKTGEKYRALIQSWAEYKKPLKVISSKVKEQNAWVGDIDDARIKWLVMDLIAQNSKLTGQLQLAKELSNINIDLRPVANNNAMENSSHPSLTKSNLLPTEVEALSHSINPDTFEKNGWTPDKHGRVKDRDGNTIFKAGFVDAIEKILAI